MTPSFSSKIILAFIICLIPFSSYSFDSAPAESTPQDNFLLVMEKTAGGASSWATVGLGAACILNVLIMLANSDRRDGGETEYASLFYMALTGALIGGLNGFSNSINMIRTDAI